MSSIEVRDCDAKRPHEIQDKAIFLGKLQGIEDEVNAKLRREMRRWLAEAAEGVIARTDPHRPPLTEAQLALELSEGLRCEGYKEPNHSHIQQNRNDTSNSCCPRV